MTSSLLNYLHLQPPFSQIRLRSEVQGLGLLRKNSESTEFNLCQILCSEKGFRVASQAEGLNQGVCLRELSSDRHIPERSSGSWRGPQTLLNLGEAGMREPRKLQGI